MSRVILAGFISGLVGVMVGAGIVLKVNLSGHGTTKPELAIVDLSSIVIRQKDEALKNVQDPEMVEGRISERMVRLARILAEMGQDRIILNKPAVVSGKIPDITEEVLKQLSSKGPDE